MAKKIMAIPATISAGSAQNKNISIKRKVAAYARVSTDREEQLTSYEAQVDYYTNYIKSREDWEFVGMYADEGISGTSTKKRTGFTRMIQDALDGKIDLIIANIKTPHLIQRQTRGKTSEVLAIRAFEAFCCPAATPFCQ